MSKKNEQEKNPEMPSALETDLYERVETFLRTQKKCDKTGSPVSNPLMLRIFGGSIYPDVYGVANPTGTDFQIHMAEGKRSFVGRSFDECKGQGISLQRFADYVYLFFPKGSWNELDDEEKSDVERECQRLKLGLLIVDKDCCQEIVNSSPNPDLLKEKNRVFARDRIVQYFPNFLGPEENAGFFGGYAELADSIVNECCGLVDECLVESFRKKTHVKKQSIKPWYLDDTFELYLRAELKNSEALLIMKPFGSEGFETHSPTLLLQERFKSSLLKDNSIRQKLTIHIDKCLKKGRIVVTRDFIYYGDDTSAMILDDMGKKNLEDFSLFERIEILGVEKRIIKRRVEESLEKMVDFSNSLRRPAQKKHPK